MNRLLSCKFNIDSGCVELKYSDGTMISINCTAVENEVADNKAVILEPQGVTNFLKLNDPHIVVFVLMCSEVTRYNRMVYRGDSPESIEERIKNDRIAFSNDKLSFADYTIDTDNKTLMEITDQVYKLYNSKINSL